MTKEEFLKRVKENEEWAPGWETIEQEFERLYPGQEPRHYGTNMMARAIFGGEDVYKRQPLYGADRVHDLCIGFTEKLYRRMGGRCLSLSSNRYL